jgi:hypothetical protein
MRREIAGYLPLSAVIELYFLEKMRFPIRAMALPGLASVTSTRRSKGTHRGGATSVAAFLDLQIWIGGTHAQQDQ